jgi:phosphoenolpyruvate carboxykinase (GTP)
MDEINQFLRTRLDKTSFSRIEAIPSDSLKQFVAESIRLCNPKSVFVCTDNMQDISYIREMAIRTGEEITLKTKGHTVHYDGYYDQARDKENTKYLVPEEHSLDNNLNQTSRDQGLEEVKEFLRDSMKEKEMIIRFFVLGPKDSEFTILTMQITDSYYVAHSEDLLYRTGYEQFKQMRENQVFFKVLHSAGELEDSVSVNIDKRRVYIDYEDDTVYSINTQYAGNTVGFKKLSLRLAIRNADRHGWLAEHMFLMGVHGPLDRVTYFAGAFPSACGKTSTSMIPGETIIGDDLAYLRKREDCIFAANVECGIFGIIRDVNAKDDPIIWQALNEPGEVIFSNVLVNNGNVFWIGDEREQQTKGRNHAGEWFEGMCDREGKKIHFASKNARYTIKLSSLPNLDKMTDHPDGVQLAAIVYGGRDADTWVPVQQSFDWVHGVVTFGASLESETTPATLGKEGVRVFQPFSNLDFISIPLGQYIQNHLDFIEGVQKPPIIFAVNYFIKDKEGNFLNDKLDKSVWMKWMELRVHEDVDAIKTPIGYIPKYEDLTLLFRQVHGKEYQIEAYEEQFEIRIPELLAKTDRIEKKYRDDVKDTPDVFFSILGIQRQRLESLREEKGDYVLPSDL